MNILDFCLKNNHELTKYQKAVISAICDKADFLGMGYLLNGGSSYGYCPVFQPGRGIFCIDKMGYRQDFSKRNFIPYTTN